MEEFMLPCFSKWLFGFDCPGCGLQRALLLLFRGDWLGAWSQYPPVFSTVLMVAATVLYLLARKKWQEKLLLVLVFANVAMVAVSYYFRIISKLDI